MRGRRDFFKELFNSVTKAAAELAYEMSKTTENLVRPPGSADEDTFTALCEKCGKCVENCKTGVLEKYKKLNPIILETPYMNFDNNYCEQCYTCIENCSSGALKFENLKKYKYIAKLLKDKCVAFKEMFCLTCYWSCPNIDRAITIRDRNYPEFHMEECKGCGRCINACPTEPKSIIMVKVKNE
ncbi:4Fe-4S dicluster domain-containing protein [Desulfurobacterium sp.]